MSAIIAATLRAILQQSTFCASDQYRGNARRKISTLDLDVQHMACRVGRNSLAAGLDD